MDAFSGWKSPIGRHPPCPTTQEPFPSFAPGRARSMSPRGTNAEPCRSGRTLFPCFKDSTRLPMTDCPGDRAGSRRPRRRPYRRPRSGARGGPAFCSVPAALQAPRRREGPALCRESLSGSRGCCAPRSGWEVKKKGARGSRDVLEPQMP